MNGFRVARRFVILPNGQPGQVVPMQDPFLPPPVYVPPVDPTIPALGTYKPSETNVGLHGVGGIPVDNDTLTLDTRPIFSLAGSSDPTKPLIVQNVRFKGVPNITDGYVRFKNCDFFWLPVAQTYNRRVVLATSTTAHSVFEDCDFHLDLDANPNWEDNIDTIQYGSFAAITCTNTDLLRCKLWDTSDGMNPTKGNVTARGCWIGKQLYISPDPLRKAVGSSNGPYYQNHADAIQIADGSNYRFEWNTLEGYNDLAYGQAAVPDNGGEGSCMGYTGPGGDSFANSCVTLNLKAGMRNIVFQNNWFEAGRAIISTTGVPIDGPTLTLRNNKYSRTVYNNNFMLINKAAYQAGYITIDNETFVDDGSPVPFKLQNL
jgi:hypothetical protein